MSFVVTFSTLAVVVGVPLREGKSGPRGGPPPLQREAWIQPMGRIAVKGYFLKLITVPDKWGRAVQKKVSYTSLVSYPPDQIRVYDTKGRPVDPKELPKLLGKPVPVLVSSDGNKVDFLYLRKVKQGTLVLVPQKK
jgi:hypothetical protein